MKQCTGSSEVVVFLNKTPEKFHAHLAIIGTKLLAHLHNVDASPIVIFITPTN